MSVHLKSYVGRLGHSSEGNWDTPPSVGLWGLGGCFLPLPSRTEALSRHAGERREDPHPAGCQGTTLCLASPQAGCGEPGSNWSHPSAAPTQVTGVTVPGPCDLLALQDIPLHVYIQQQPGSHFRGLLFPADVPEAGVRDQHLPQGQGRAGRESWLQFQLGVVPFQQLGRINCLARAPRHCR